MCQVLDDRPFLPPAKIVTAYGEVDSIKVCIRSAAYRQARLEMVGLT